MDMAEYSSESRSVGAVGQVIGKRQPNFTSFEIDTLRSYLRQYQDVIEDRRTDKITTQAKDNAWEEVASRFNRHTRVYYRTPKQLKACWKNIKFRNKSQNQMNERQSPPPSSPDQCVNQDSGGHEIVIEGIKKELDMGLDDGDWADSSGAYERTTDKSNNSSSLPPSFEKSHSKCQHKYVINNVTSIVDTNIVPVQIRPVANLTGARKRITETEPSNPSLNGQTGNGASSSENPVVYTSFLNGQTGTYASEKSTECDVIPVQSTRCSLVPASNQEVHSINRPMLEPSVPKKAKMTEGDKEITDSDREDALKFKRLEHEQKMRNLKLERKFLIEEHKRKMELLQLKIDNYKGKVDLK